MTHTNQSDVKISELQLVISQQIQIIKELEDKLALEQAERVHLKDATRHANSLSHNLLCEEIIPRLNLSLKALLRDNPKIESAVHQIDLVIDSANKRLSSFK